MIAPLYFRGHKILTKHISLKEQYVGFGGNEKADESQDKSSVGAAIVLTPLIAF